MLLCLLLILVACSPHKRQAGRNLMTFPYAFVESTGVEKRHLAEKWWTVFEDENLNLLMKEFFPGKRSSRILVG